VRNGFQPRLWCAILVWPAAAAYAQLGETERAFESLDAAFLQRSD